MVPEMTSKFWTLPTEINEVLTDEDSINTRVDVNVICMSTTICIGVEGIPLQPD